ncbi:hypothetical protein BpHYR1_021129 [Brachionus plicatilis]|uniref:Uncharacterized protein n=1 Tax=Brachionus plicatilis TaxID=10195 RepID=A0A3M7QXB8_BRAPC|nr:hypothetical protein BpHYR1_021129 [Brachionus plicatilis]
MVKFSIVRIKMFSRYMNLITFISPQIELGIGLSKKILFCDHSVHQTDMIPLITRILINTLSDERNIAKF